MGIVIMSDLKCPACLTAMERSSEFDVEIDVCPRCAGRFLDKGELDAVATGMAGDIEYCSIDTEAHPDEFPPRACPRCPEKQMRKINLLAFSKIIFDYCPHCGGFFLDKGEAESMNRELADLSGAPTGEEFQERINDHEVRLNRIRDVVTNPNALWMGAVSDNPIESFQLIVSFRAPLGLALRIFPEPWHARLVTVLHLFKGQDIQTGDKTFDAAFIVWGDDENAVKRLLSGELRRALLDFKARQPRIFSRSGSLTVEDDRIEYREGPYLVGKVTSLKESAAGVMAELVQLAGLFEGS